MKKWQIITIGAVCGAAVIAAAGRYTYTSYVIPQYIEPVLEQVAVAVNDKQLQSELIEYAEELEDEGILDSAVVSRYIAKYSMPEYEDYADAFEEEEDDGGEALILNSAVAQAQAQLGISSVKVNDDEFDNTKYTYSEKNKENVKKSAAIAASAKAMEEEKEKREKASSAVEYSDDDDDYTFDDDNNQTSTFGLGGFGGVSGADKSDENRNNKSSEKSASSADSKNSKKSSDNSSGKSSKGTSLYTRAKNAMTAADLSAAYDLAMKIDMSYVKSIYSDKEELKSYLSTVLTDSEIAKAMELYLKYAYLLGE